MYKNFNRRGDFFSFDFFILCYIVVIMRENCILKLSFRKEKKLKDKFRFYKECNFDWHAISTLVTRMSVANLRIAGEYSMNKKENVILNC